MRQAVGAAALPPAALLLHRYRSSAALSSAVALSTPLTLRPLNATPLPAQPHVPTPTLHPQPPRPTYTGNVPNCKYYIIQGGDTLESIALALGLAPIDLQALNPEASMLQVNQFVKLTGW